jgi:hypothetical protein
MGSDLRGPFEKFVDSHYYYSESELCEGAVTVSFSKYLPWQAMHFLQRSTHFSKVVFQLDRDCRQNSALFFSVMRKNVWL